MAQLNITLNQEEILELLTKDPGETFKENYLWKKQIRLRSKTDDIRIGLKVSFLPDIVAIRPFMVYNNHGKAHLLKGVTDDKTRV